MNSAVLRSKVGITRSYYKGETKMLVKKKSRRSHRELSRLLVGNEASRNYVTEDADENRERG
jgi:hypothetical protein